MDPITPILKTRSKLPIIIGAVILVGGIFLGRWLSVKTIPPAPTLPVAEEKTITQNLSASSSPEVVPRQMIVPRVPENNLNQPGVGNFDPSTVPQVQQGLYNQMMGGGLENLTPEQRALIEQNVGNGGSFNEQQLMEELLKTMSSSSQPQL